MSKLKDSNFTVTGINTVGLVSLLAYTVRTFNEVNSNIEGLKQELENIKKNNVENNRRSNIALTHLNEKINQNIRIVSPPKKKIVKKENPVYVHRETQIEDDPILELGNTDEISGALSELLGN